MPRKPRWSDVTLDLTAAETPKPQTQPKVETPEYLVAVTAQPTRLPIRL